MKFCLAAFYVQVVYIMYFAVISVPISLTHVHLDEYQDIWCMMALSKICKHLPHWFLFRTVVMLSESGEQVKADDLNWPAGHPAIRCMEPKQNKIVVPPFSAKIHCHVILVFFRNEFAKMFTFYTKYFKLSSKYSQYRFKQF